MTPRYIIHAATGSAALAAMLLGSAAMADVLELRNGATLNGQYMGGSQSSVRFAVGGEVQVVPTSSILALTFTGGGAPAAAQPAAPVSASSGTVAAGSKMLIKLDQALDSRRHAAGHKFTATLETALMVNSAVLVPSGSKVYGVLSQAKQSGRIAGRTSFVMKMTDIKVGERVYPIAAGELQAATQGTGKSSARRVARGAAIGALAGGSKGARTGAKWGAAAAIVTRGNSINIAAGTLLEFDLLKPLSL